MTDLVIFEADSGEISVRLEGETVWLRRDQITELFGRDRTVIGRHINNVFREGELDKDSVCAKYAHTADDGKTYQVEHYNLDVIISVGYRVKSQQGVRFRQWATRLIREFLVQGYAIDQVRFQANAQELESALKLIRHSMNSAELNVESGKGIIDIISRYTHTFLWLQRYDEGLLTEPQGSEGGQLPGPHAAQQALEQLKADLIGKSQATMLFAQPRGDGLGSIFGNLSQSVFGQAAYPTIEGKAAHLLYFVVKNHPFADGNKRSAAFLFVDFLHRNNHLLGEDGEAVINDAGLAALTLLVAESDPKQKDVMIRLIMNMLTPMKNG
ncbi:virulence protein RhuM/Fic/DOC family protein [Aeromonas salmonicida]|uniref:virulence protein RhuM/Fic/DOC family protein n=1 Tax=Aeromonas salmonicida TaxID=645 RepID=UPI001788C719|nr:virulence protein RhuM/Fic/DOC family protein [Aeromonas salmonicida]QOI95890.1 virulence protein RhuM/Fic/DOC family protein [Aeromonas salmonicida subsp. masoucida]